MSESFQITIVVLLAFFLGVTVPLAVIFGIAVRRASAHLDDAMKTLATLKPIINAIGEGKDVLLKSIDTLDRLSTTAQQLSKVGVAVGAAVGPALVAAIRSYQESAPQAQTPDAETAESAAAHTVQHLDPIHRHSASQ